MNTKTKANGLSIAILASLAPSAGHSEEPVAQIKVTEMRNEKGSVRLLVFDKEEGFPKDHTKAVFALVAKASKDLIIKVPQIKAGTTYAVSAIHDEDENGELEKNFFGIPKEGFAFSGEFGLFSGAPSFKESTFKLDSLSDIVSIKMNYF